MTSGDAAIQRALKACMRAEAAVSKSTESLVKWNQVSSRGATTSTTIRTIGKLMDQHIDALGNRL